MDTENLPAVQAEIVVEEGWSTDPSGLPIFTAATIDAIENEMVDLRSSEGNFKLKLAAVLTEASERRFYGDNTLKKVAKENQMTYSTARSMVAGYKRMRLLPAEDRETIVNSITSGELYWSKPEIAAPVKDNQDYMELMHASADGSLSNSKLRKRVSTLSGQTAIEGDSTDDGDIPEDEDIPVDAPLVDEDESHADKMARFIVGGLEIARVLEDQGGIKAMSLDEIPDELTVFTKLIRRWDDQLRRKQKGE
jgi:hypothetical protein